MSGVRNIKTIDISDISIIGGGTFGGGLNGSARKLIEHLDSLPFGTCYPNAHEACAAAGTSPASIQRVKKHPELVIRRFEINRSRHLLGSKETIEALSKGK